MNLSLVALLALVSSVQAADTKKVEYGKIATYETKPLKEHFKVNGKKVTDKVAKDIFTGINTILKDTKVSLAEKKELILKGLPVELASYLGSKDADSILELSKTIEANYPDVAASTLASFRTSLINAKGESERKTKTSKIRKEFIMAAGEVGIHALQQINTDENVSGNNKVVGTPILHLVHADYWKLLNDNPQLCAFVEVSTIELLEEAALKHFTSECFNRVHNIGDAKGAKFVAKVNGLAADLYSQYNGTAVINEKVAAKLSPEQVASFASALTVEKDVRNCQLLPLDSIDIKKSASKVHLTCLLKYLNGQVKQNDKTIATKLQGRWSKFAPELYKQASELLNKDHIKLIALALNSEEHKHVNAIKADSLNAMLKSEVFATTFAPSKTIKGLKMEPKILAKVRNSILIQSVLVENTEKLADDILSYASVDFFKAIEFENKKKSISGLHVLDSITSANIKEIVENLGKEIKGAENPWSLVDNEADFTGVKAIFNSPPKKAVKNVQSGADRETLNKNPNLFKGIKNSVLEEKDIDYTKITRAQLKAIITGDFAARVSQEVFMKLATDSLAVIDGPSANALLRRFTLPADRTVRFADDAFSLLDADSFSKLSLKHVNNEQYKHMNPKIIASLTVDQLKEITEKVAFLGAKQVAALPNDFLATINVEKVTASALTDLNAAQIKVLVPLFGKLSEEQVKLIGSQSTADKAAILKALKDETSKLSPKAAEALAARLAAEKVDDKSADACVTSGLSTKTIVLIASGVILLGGIGVFVIVKFVV